MGGRSYGNASLGITDLAGSMCLSWCIVGAVDQW